MEDEELKFGPNGGLIFCMEYLMENMDWLEKQLSGSIGEDGEVYMNCSRHHYFINFDLKQNKCDEIAVNNSNLYSECRDILT